MGWTVQANTHADLLALLHAPIAAQLADLALWISPLALGELLPRMPRHLRRFQLRLPYTTDYGLAFTRDARGVLGELFLDLRLVYPDHRDLGELMRGLQLLPSDQLTAITIAEPRRPESSVVLHRVRQVLATQTGAKIALTFRSALAAIAARDHRARQLAGGLELADLVADRLDLREARGVVAVAIDELAVELAHGVAVRRIFDRGAHDGEPPAERELATELGRERVAGVAIFRDARRGRPRRARPALRDERDPRGQSSAPA